MMSGVCQDLGIISPGLNGVMNMTVLNYDNSMGNLNIQFGSSTKPTNLKSKFYYLQNSCNVG